MKDVEEWWERAVCKQADPFPPERETADDGTFIEPARVWSERVEEHAQHFRSTQCAVCPVRERCFQEGMRTRAPAGVWGGISEAMRTRWLKAGRKWHCSVCGAPIEADRMRSDPDLTTCRVHTKRKGK